MSRREERRRRLIEKKIVFEGKSCQEKEEAGNSPTGNSQLEEEDGMQWMQVEVLVCRSGKR